MGILTHDQLAFIFGLLGTTISFFVFLAPMPTFYKIWKKKSSEGYQSIPYVIALSSAMLLLYYGFLKTNAYIIIIINAIGCVIEISYLALYLLYAPKKEKRNAVKMVLLFNVVGFGIMIMLTFVLVKGPQRVTAVGWICAAFNLAVFAAPLSIMRQVIRTKSVEFMPFTLSFFLTLCATSWFFYGFFVKDMYIAVPNVLGFLFGIAQMILYMIYKDGNKNDYDIEKQKHQHVFTADDTSHDQNPKYGDGVDKIRQRSIDIGDHRRKSVEMFDGNYRSIKSNDQNHH
ncbi:bidirectional sugar transporter NEC1-like [Tripterygium wilfordii]|uniref:Bidirectional sugar transporter SWEET n=1 Tax=Tripterygium wilfordii TaxID=458696 RepID=A0A7J7BUX7_TRIWF|nr:bidirectional sugar transporter SWEET9-like [Tripterygium wilfordii]KAF5725693.1 bidirectional sugar transporter NEC1-like [Tripterygium wilfordii]